MVSIVIGGMHTQQANKWKKLKSLVTMLLLRELYKYIQKLVILQSIGIMVIKIKGTTVITKRPADILVGI